MKNIGMVYDFETTGFLNDPKAETCQFAALFIEKVGEEDYEILESVEIKKQVQLSSFLLENGHNQLDYDAGLSKEDYVAEIKRLLSEYKPSFFVGANIRDFDNKFLKRELECKELLYLLKQHDTLIYERLLLGLNNFSKDKNGIYHNCKVEGCCERHGIEFDPSQAHDAIYDVEKTFEVFKAQEKIINKLVDKSLEIKFNEFDF